MCYQEHCSRFRMEHKSEAGLVCVISSQEGQPWQPGPCREGSCCPGTAEMVGVSAPMAACTWKGFCAGSHFDVSSESQLNFVIYSWTWNLISVSLGLVLP